MEIVVEEVDTKFDVLDVAAEKLDEERLMHKVGEADERLGLLAIGEQCSCQEAQVLVKINMVKWDKYDAYFNISNIRSVDQERENQMHK